MKASGLMRRTFFEEWSVKDVGLELGIVMEIGIWMRN